MEKKMTESFRKRVQATPGIITAEEEDIKLQGLKESVNELLSAVLATVEDNPELKGKVYNHRSVLFHNYRSVLLCAL